MHNAVITIPLGVALNLSADDFTAAAGAVITNHGTLSITTGTNQGWGFNLHGGSLINYGTLELATADTELFIGGGSGNLEFRLGSSFAAVGGAIIRLPGWNDGSVFGHAPFVFADGTGIISNFPARFSIGDSIGVAFVWENEGNVFRNTDVNADTHLVIFENWDGTVLAEHSNVPHGSGVTPPAIPSGPPGFEFISWLVYGSDYTDVRQDTFVVAQFGVEITFRDFNGDFLTSAWGEPSFDYDGVIVALLEVPGGATPVRDAALEPFFDDDSFSWIDHDEDRQFDVDLGTIPVSGPTTLTRTYSTLLNTRDLAYITTLFNLFNATEMVIEKTPLETVIFNVGSSGTLPVNITIPESVVLIFVLSEVDFAVGTMITNHGTLSIATSGLDFILDGGSLINHGELDLALETTILFITGGGSLIFHVGSSFIATGGATLEIDDGEISGVGGLFVIVDDDDIEISDFLNGEPFAEDGVYIWQPGKFVREEP
jgi:hypothetical protein